jgi:hypothetical protein
MKKITLFILSLSLFTIACKKEKEETKTINDMVTNPVSDTLGHGSFVGVDHSLSGKAILYKDNTNNHILRLEHFNMTAAPDADVFLSTTSSYSGGTVIKVSDLNQNTNYTNSAINIDVAENINFNQYKYVIVWCTQYSAYFGHAPLN